MEFSRPLYLWFLLPLALVGLWYLISSRARPSPRLEALARMHSHTSGLELTALLRTLSTARLISRLLGLLALASFSCALAGPSYGEQSVLSRRFGLDLAIALDISRSMDCRDQAPSRLAAAKTLALELSRRLEGTRIALAIGKGEALLVQPLSEDRESLRAILEGISSDSFSASGSNVEALVDAALSAFPPNSPGRPVILVLSDGEAHSGVLVSAAERAQRAGVAIFCAGFGTEAGAEVPQREGEVRDVNDPLQYSRRNLEALRVLSAITGGQSLDGSSPQAVSELFSGISALAGESSSEYWRTEPIERQGLFVAFALLALAASRLLFLWRPR